jgi:alpha-glucosidase
MEFPTSTTNSANKTEFYPGSINKITFNEGVFTFECQNQVTIKITVLTDDIIRVRYGIENVFEDDFSYAICEKFVKKIVNLDTSETDDAYFIHTSTLDIELRKANAAVTMLSKQGKIICQDEKGFHWEDNYTFGGHIVEMSKNIQEGECFYGLGDKPTKSNLRGSRFENWGSDVYGYQKDQDPLYKNIPFYMGCHSGLAYGIFFDNSFRSYFDFGHERGQTSSFWAHGGEMNYYFFNGPNLMDVSARYSKLTGVPELPPMWALGYHQCKWSYYPEEQVKGIASKMRELAIPCDAIYLDIDYMDGFRCFTWDLEKFPEPKRMIQELKADGFKTVVIIDPGIKVDKDYWVFKEGLEKDVFCRRADGPFMKGKVWPGDCYFPDYTNPDVREWWTTLFKELIADCQVAGVWNDMNEPAVMEVESKTFPNDVRHDYDGHPCSHRKAHNVYGMQMSRATYDGVKKFAENKRPFIITRSCYSGVQRYTSAWTGDNIATWEHLWLSNMQCQRLSISGLSFIGSDIGGFIDQPTPELFARWIQLAVFHPLCRTHSSGNHGDQEPWSFGEQTTDIVRKYVELRYKLLPYLYTSFYQYTKDGYPILRPLAFVDQADPNLLHRSDEFMFGPNVLISPILKENSKGKYVYLPRNNWYNYWTGEMITGGQEQWVDAPLEVMPIFIKAGTIIPYYPIQQFVGEKTIDQLTLNVYYNEGSMESELYEDDGEGYEYEKGIYTLKTFEQKSNKSSIKISQSISGHYKASYGTYKLVFIGVPFKVKDVKAIGEIQKHGYTDDGHFEVEVASSFTELDLSI